jgi:K+-sensing histidine kinase KdpD
VRRPPARAQMSDFRRSSGSMQVIKVHNRAPWLLYAEALLTVLATVAISWYIRDVLVVTRFLLFWPASVLIAWRCGLGPVAVASFVGAMLWNAAFDRSVGAPVVLTTTELVTIAVYVAVSMSLGFTVDHLRRARIRVAQATNGMTEAMFVFDAQWHLRFVNSAGAQLLQQIGMKLADVRGRDIWAGAPGATGTRIGIVSPSISRRRFRKRKPGCACDVSRRTTAASRHSSATLRRRSVPR